MSKVDYIVDGNEYLIEFRVWFDPTKAPIIGQVGYAKTIRIPTNAIRAEGMIAVEAEQKIVGELIEFHREICRTRDVYNTLSQITTEEER